MEEYKSKEFCKAYDCPVLEMANIAGEKYAQHCKYCKAYLFYEWLKKEGYKITKG